MKRIQRNHLIKEAIKNFQQANKLNTMNEQVGTDFPIFILVNPNLLDALTESEFVNLWGRLVLAECRTQIHSRVARILSADPPELPTEEQNDEE